jgi:glyoxylase-like metal-dependent hydrolase (beta-lactamase superfamily II)
MPICKQNSEIKPNIYLIDVQQMGMQKITATFLYWDGNDCILMDVGTSDDVRVLLRAIKKLQIPFNKVRGVVNTHYHFDHGGGSLRFWEKMQEKNPEFKIYASHQTYEKLQNAQEHIEGARTTFGDFVGVMNPIPESGFEIVNTDVTLPFNLQNNFSIKLITTPGHTPDHVSPTIFNNGKPYFSFAGESCGTLFHSQKLVSLPTSMPPNFNFETYMQSLQKIMDLNVDCVGFCHMGAIIGEQDVQTFLNEHKNYMINWRNKMKQVFAENPSTKYVIDNTVEYWIDRFDFGDPNNPLFQNLRLALTYGMMVDLGFRQPKYEKKKENR